MDRKVRILARYEEAQADAFSSDVNVADGGIIGWPDLEQRYGILLDPARLRGEPGIVEGSFERGRVILSLIHFDAPGDRNGAVVLRNLWGYLASSRPSHPPPDGGAERAGHLPDVPQRIRETVDEIQAAVADLIAAGARNFLWYWRNPLLLQWRRGVRGLEYATLAVMIDQIVRCLRYSGAADPGCLPALPLSIDPPLLEADLKEIREQLIPFCEKAKRLLVRERFAMMTAPLSPMECADAEISSLRQELFASAMSHGGLFKRLIALVDRLLYRLIKTG